MQEIVRYLLDNLYLDFQGDVTMERMRTLLGEDDSSEARRLLARLVSEGGVDDLLLALADTLREHIPRGITEDVLREQIRMYVES